MTHRSPARFLAPLVLIAAIVTIYLVARPELGSSDGSGSATTSTTTSAKKTTATTTARKKTAAAKARAKTYTVKSGDVLGSISESTGVAVEDLLDFNDLEDAQSLRVGQKLKLVQ